jgi:hypothetical protein
MCPVNSDLACELGRQEWHTKRKKKPCLELEELDILVGGQVASLEILHVGFRRKYSKIRQKICILFNCTILQFFGHLKTSALIQIRVRTLKSKGLKHCTKCTGYLINKKQNNKKRRTDCLFEGARPVDEQLHELRAVQLQYFLSW